MTHALKIVIFSKDRACQLDSLLRSLIDNFHVSFSGITVLHRATTAEFIEGYSILKLKNIVEGITWQPEKNFSEDVRGIVGACDDDSLIMFLVDDAIIFRPCILDYILNVFSPKHLFISLRASRAYPADTPPEFKTNGEFLEWKWNYSKRKWVTWNYPFSMDGNIFHARHLKKVVQKISFEGPNSLEGRMHGYRHAWWIKRTPWALAPLDAVVFNNPLNRVQTEGETWHRDVTAEQLNTKYKEGFSIDNSVLYNSRPDSTHFSVDASFTKEKTCRSNIC
jgi:hypothetical protein